MFALENEQIFKNFQYVKVQTNLKKSIITSVSYFTCPSF